MTNDRMGEVSVRERARGRRGLLGALLVSVGVAFVWSGFRPHDQFTWFLEVVPVIGAAPIVLLTERRFPLTTLAYCLISIHAIILMIGGHYTYAEEPLFNWIRDTFHLTRNHYDRLGHFAQGFVPAIVVREILLRTSPLRQGKWLFTIVLFMCLGFSAMYELFEWSMAVLTGSKADAFLGTQGDPWDTQKDMTMAVVGAVAALMLLSRFHDRQLRRCNELHPTNQPSRAS